MIKFGARNFGLAMLGAGVLALSGCDQIGSPIDAIAGSTVTPDEFEVIARKPLRMPSSVNLSKLPEPRLGAPSPLEPNPNADAVQALFGTGGTGGAGGTSTSEAALVGAAQASADGRVVTDAEIAAAKQSDRYEARSLSEVLFGDSDTVVEDALDPDVEARRLQTEGRSSAPVNPNPVQEEE